MYSLICTCWSRSLSPSRQRYLELGLYRPLRPKRVIPYPITIQNIATGLFIYQGKIWDAWKNIAAKLVLYQRFYELVVTTYISWQCSEVSVCWNTRCGMSGLDESRMSSGPLDPGHTLVFFDWSQYHCQLSVCLCAGPLDLFRSLDRDAAHTPLQIYIGLTNWIHSKPHIWNIQLFKCPLFSNVLPIFTLPLHVYPASLV